MDKHVSARFIACLFPDYCDESVRTALDFVDNKDILVYKDTDKFYFRYISGGRIKVSHGLNYFVHGDILYHYNQYCHAYDFIESKVKEATDKDSFDWVKKLVNMRSHTNEEIRREYSECRYKLKRLKHEYDGLSWASLMLIVIYIVTLISLGGCGMADL